MTPNKAIDKYIVLAKAATWDNVPGKSGLIFAANGVKKSQGGFKVEQLVKMPMPGMTIGRGVYRGHSQHPQFGNLLIICRIFTARFQDPFGSDALTEIGDLAWGWTEYASVKGQADGIVYEGHEEEQPEPIIIDGSQPMMYMEVKMRTRIGAYAAGDY
jgi:hypothetical protein